MFKRTTILTIIMGVVLSSCNKEIDNINPQSDNADISLFEYGDGLYDLAGHGTDVTIDYATHEASKSLVIDITRLNNEDSEAVRYMMLNIQAYDESVYSENAEEFSKQISKTQTTLVGFSLFGKEISSSFKNSTNTSEKFDGKYIYSQYDALIKTKRVIIVAPVSQLTNYLMPSFIDYAKNETPANIVKRFGTHVMTDILVGGRAKIRYQAETRSNERKEAAEAGMKWAMGDMKGITNDSKVDISKKSQNFNEAMFISSRGGSIPISSSGGISSPIQGIDLDPWKNSVNVGNSVLIDFGSPNSLIPIWEFITDPTKKAEVKAYVEKYLKDNGTVTEDLPVPLHSYFNEYLVDHLLTTVQINWPGYKYGGISFYAFNYKAPGTIPIYSYFIEDNPYDAIHLLTTVQINWPGYKYGGISFYAYPQQEPGTIPIYSYLLEGVNNHWDYVLTTVQINWPGYKYGGISFYALPKSYKARTKINHTYENHSKSELVNKL